MSLLDSTKALLDRRGLRPFLVPVANWVARSRNKGVRRIFCDDGIWIHETARGYFAYQQPFIRLDMAKMEEQARANFLWGYEPQPGHTVIDVGAGVGEETLTLSRALGGQGKLIAVEAHPRTYQCLEKLVHLNGLTNVIPIHKAVTADASGTAMIGDSQAYLANRLSRTRGIAVRATTIDEIHRQLGLGRVHFLKMNIEGAERLAIRGMSETLRQTRVLCVSCHDFLAEATGDEALRTKREVRQFFRQNRIRIRERTEPDLPPYVRDQIWGYNDALVQRESAAS
jgi:FkbM family methyltransferase